MNCTAIIDQTSKVPNNNTEPQKIARTAPSNPAIINCNSGNTRSSLVARASLATLSMDTLIKDKPKSSNMFMVTSTEITMKSNVFQASNQKVHRNTCSLNTSSTTNINSNKALA